MRRVPHSTIEQWSVLRAVVEHGSFAEAAAKLHRSQSSLSYAIARLQERLGVRLLELQGRRAVLTTAGAALLAEAVSIIDELVRIEERTQAIAAGEAVRIRLLVDSIFPKARLFDALQAFTRLHPHVEIHLRETVRQAVRETQDEDFDIAVLVAEPGARLAELIADVPLLAVARADHPLLQRARSPGRALLAQHNRVEIRGLESVGEKINDSAKIWRMNTVEAAIEGVRRGLCYGWLPHHLIADDLQEGILKPLPLKTGTTRHIPLGLFIEKEPATGAASALASLLCQSKTSGWSAS